MINWYIESEKGNILCYYRKFSDFYFFGTVRNASVLLGPYWVVWSILWPFMVGTEIVHTWKTLWRLCFTSSPKKYYHVTDGCVALLVEICKIKHKQNPGRINRMRHTILLTAVERAKWQCVLRNLCDSLLINHNSSDSKGIPFSPTAAFFMWDCAGYRQTPYRPTRTPARPKSICIPSFLFLEILFWNYRFVSTTFSFHSSSLLCDLAVLKSLTMDL